MEGRLEVLFRAVHVASVVAVVEGLEAADDEVQPVKAGGEGFKLGAGHSSTPWFGLSGRQNFSAYRFGFFQSGFSVG